MVAHFGHNVAPLLDERDIARLASTLKEGCVWALPCQHWKSLPTQEVILFTICTSHPALPLYLARCLDQIELALQPPQIELSQCLVYHGLALQ